MRLNKKLILLIMLSLIFLGVLGGYLYIKKPTTTTYSTFEDPLFKKGIERFVDNLYDKTRAGFKNTQDAPVTIRSTFYGLIINKMFLGKNTQEKINIDALTKRVQSYYITPGYYSEKNEEPIFSTVKALSIDVQYPQDLGQTIDQSWLSKNSLENKNLEPAKLDPEYQFAVTGIYRLLGVPTKIEEISVPYLNYYCGFSLPQDISDSEYLREKYYQFLIIYNFTKTPNASESCLTAKDIWDTQEKLSKIQSEELKDIKEIFFTFHLKNFYEVSSNSEQGKAFKGLLAFRKGNGFKEYFDDAEANLTGTYYAMKIINQFYNNFMTSPLESTTRL